MGYAGQLENLRFQGTDSTGPAVLVDGRMLDALLDGETDSRVVRLVARSGWLPEKGHYAVAVRHAVDDSAQLEHPPPLSTIGGLRVLWRSRSACQIGVVVLTDVDVSTFADAQPVTRTGGPVSAWPSTAWRACGEPGSLPSSPRARSRPGTGSPACSTG